MNKQLKLNIKNLDIFTDNTKQKKLKISELKHLMGGGTQSLLKRLHVSRTC